MADLLHGNTALIATVDSEAPALTSMEPIIVGGVDSAEEEELLLELNRWVVDQGLPEGHYLHELADEPTGNAIAVLDLAWPYGLQEGLSQPVAVLLDEGPDVLACANRFGFQCFTSADDFKTYVRQKILAEFMQYAGEAAE